MFVMGWLSTRTPASRVVASVPAAFAALRTCSEKLLGVSIQGKIQFLGQGMKRSPAEWWAADLKQLRGISSPNSRIWTSSWLVSAAVWCGWLVFSASLRPAELSKQRPGYPPGQSRVRGIARSIAPSRLSPHWAQLSDPLPLLPLLPETIAVLISVELSVVCSHFSFHTIFFEVALLLNLEKHQAVFFFFCLSCSVWRLMRRWV